MERRIFQLPGEFAVKNDTLYETLQASEIGRLSIAGFVDTHFSLAPDELQGYGDPLLLLDGRPYDVNIEVASEKNITYYGIVYDGGFALRKKSWDHTVCGTNSLNPFVYYGSAVYPSDAPAIIFESPIPYNQAAFERQIDRLKP